MIMDTWKYTESAARGGCWNTKESDCSFYWTSAWRYLSNWRCSWTSIIETSWNDGQLEWCQQLLIKVIKTI